MTNEPLSKKTAMDSEEGFPIQAKLLLTVIAVGLAALILKVIGIF